MLFLFVSCNNTKQTKSESKKYNIVFILADDMGRNYAEGRPGDPGSQGFDDVLNTGKPKETDGPAKDAHKSALLTERTLAFLDKNKDKPFFAYVSFNAVRRPLMEKPEPIAKYKAKPGSNDSVNNPVTGLRPHLFPAITN